ncbi:hypothetical protein NMG60_11027017 [Bertholletia excelsa]
MPSLTISWQSALPGTHSLLSSSSSCSKPFKSPQFCLNSCLNDQTSKLSHRNQNLFLSRYGRQQYLHVYKEFRSLTDNPDSRTELTNYVDYSLLDGLAKKKIGRDFRDVPAPSASFQSSLKFFLLFGLLALGGTQQAVAASDLASGLQSFLGDVGDISTGFTSAFLLIFFSELGDKTFFIAALLAARNSGATVFIGTFGALAAMTIISVVLGRTFHYVDGVLPFRFGDTDLPIDDIAAACLLVYFGVSTLLEAASSDGLKGEEEQKEAELAVSEFSGNGAGILSTANTVISIFLLVFIAEWGDKSFFSTIALAAASSPPGVIAGALAGHAVATLLAVTGGSLLGTFLSEKVIAYIGGVLFLVFAAVTFVEIAT